MAKSNGKKKTPVTKNEKSVKDKKNIIDDIIGQNSFSEIESNTSSSEEESDDETKNVTGIEGENDEDKNADKLDNNDYGDEDIGIADDEVNDGDGNDDKEDKCMYKFANNDDEDEDQIDDLYFDDDNVQRDINTIIKNPELRQAKPILTKYERVRALGARTKQLSLGAKPMIKNVEHLTPRQVALLELKHGKMPYWIEKVMPNGNREFWKISELKPLN